MNLLARVIGSLPECAKVLKISTYSEVSIIYTNEGIFTLQDGVLEKSSFELPDNREKV